MAFFSYYRGGGQFSWLSYFRNLSEMSKHWLPLCYHLHICAETPDKYEGDLEVSDLHFWWIKISCNREIKERNFNNPHRCTSLKRIWQTNSLSVFRPGATYTQRTHDVITHRGRVTHICVSKLTIIGSDNGLLPGRQAIIWTNAGIFNNVNSTLRNKLQWTGSKLIHFH